MMHSFIYTSTTNDILFFLPLVFFLFTTGWTTAAAVATAAFLAYDLDLGEAFNDTFELIFVLDLTTEAEVFTEDEGAKVACVDVCCYFFLLLTPFTFF